MLLTEEWYQMMVVDEAYVWIPGYLKRLWKLSLACTMVMWIDERLSRPQQVRPKHAGESILPPSPLRDLLTHSHGAGTRHPEEQAPKCGIWL